VVDTGDPALAGIVAANDSKSGLNKDWFKWV